MSAQPQHMDADRTHALIEQDSAIFVARQSGLYRYHGTDGARQSLYQSWQPEQALPTMAVALSPNFADDGLIVAGINGGVARSQDAGENWDALPFRRPPPLVTCLALSPAFDRDSCLLAGTLEDGMFRSIDGGHHWGAFNFGLYDRNVYCLALSPAFSDDGLAYIGASTGIYRSENGGRFWGDLPLQSGDETVLSLALSPRFPADNTLFAGTESHGLLRSIDGGATWQRLPMPEGAVNAVLTLAALDGSAWLAAQVNDGVYVSPDDGANWQQLARSNAHALAAGRNDTLLLGMADGSLRREAR